MGRESVVVQCQPNHKMIVRVITNGRHPVDIIYAVIIFEGEQKNRLYFFVAGKWRNAAFLMQRIKKRLNGFSISHPKTLFKILRIRMFELPLPVISLHAAIESLPTY